MHYPPPPQLSILCSENSELKLQLQNNNAKYHHKCKSKYNTRMYNRAKNEFNEFIDVSPAETETSQHRDVEKSFLDELKCIFCTQNDDLCNFMAAGTYHASQRKVSATHLKELETKWRKWAFCLDEYVHVVTALSMGDLAASELYYHKVCYSDFYNAYCRQQTLSCIETDEQWIKSISFNKISRICMKNNLDPRELYFMSKNWKKFIFPCSNVTILIILVMSHDFLIPYFKLFLI